MSSIEKRQRDIFQQLSEQKEPEKIVPRFKLTGISQRNHMSVSVSYGSICYVDTLRPLIDSINFSLMGNERMAIVGKNGSRKSTLMQAILQHKNILKSGTWRLPKLDEIGYLDQNYSNLIPKYSVIQMLKMSIPGWSRLEIRKHLSAFLFRTNEEVNCPIEFMSGGEKTRLSLALIAAQPPKLLLLDEITNNTGRETKDHVIQVINEFPGSIIIISHDRELLNQISISFYCFIEGNKFYN